MEGLTPELVQWLASQGPLGILVVLGVKMVWNGTSKRLTGIEAAQAKQSEFMQSVDRRLMRIEIHHKVDGAEKQD